MNGFSIYLYQTMRMGVIFKLSSRPILTGKYFVTVMHVAESQDSCLVDHNVGSHEIEAV